MAFEKEKNLEVLQCDYKTYADKKKKIEKSNKEAKQYNEDLVHKAKGQKTIFVLLTFIFVAISSSLLYFLVIRGYDAEIASSNFYKLLGIEGPEWMRTVWDYIQYVLPALVITIFTIIALSKGCKYIDAKAKSSKLEITPIPENVRFATASYKRDIGTLSLSQYDSVPNKPIKVQMSCELEKDDGLVESYTSKSANWTLIQIPGMFKKVLDIPNTTILIPFINEGQPILTAEDALINERLLHRNDKIKYEAEVTSLREQLQTSESQLNVERTERISTTDKLLACTEENQNLKNYITKNEEDVQAVQQRYAEFEEEKARLTNENKDLQAEISNLNGQIESYKGQIDTYNQGADALSKDYQKAQEDNLQVKEENSNLSRQLEKANEENENLKGEVEKYRTESEELKTKTRDIQKQIDEAEKKNIDTIYDLRDRLKDAEDELNATKKEYEESSNQYGAIIRERDDALEKYNKLEIEYNRVVTDKNNLQNEVDGIQDLKKKADVSDAAIEELKRQLSEEQARSETYQRNVAILTEQNQSLEQDLNRTKKDLAKISKENANMGDELNSQRRERALRKADEEEIRGQQYQQFESKLKFGKSAVNG